MEVSALTELQRAEVALVIGSGLFAKAPRLERFFEYICRCQLGGRGDQIKEYSIAVEALGRPADFDPKKDSIVRVEAHRLRKRLDEYYRGPGLSDPVRISIPNGQYRPLFIACESEAEKPFDETEAGPKLAPLTDIELIESPSPETPIPDSARVPGTRFRVIIAAALLVCSVIGVWWLIRSRHAATAAPPPPATAHEIWTPPTTAAPVPGELRLLAGYHGPPLLDDQGHTWSADAYFNGGRSVPIPTGRVNEWQGDYLPIKAQRSGRFHYDIPLRNRCYEMHLYLAETEYGPGNAKSGPEDSRLFGISVNGEPLLTAFDPLEAAGAPNRLYERVFKNIHPAPDGKLHLAFEPDSGDGFLNALELLPSPPGRMHPIRIVAQSSPVMDSEGRLWSADRYYAGGRTVVRAKVVSNSQEALFQGERYGNFSYRIPLAPGKYRVTIYFAETWFGAESPEPAVGSRVFNVFANGRALLQNYQIAVDAGGSNRGVKKVFNDLEPNAHGLLLLDFIPLKNYAEINALEIVETG